MKSEQYKAKGDIQNINEEEKATFLTGTSTPTTNQDISVVGSGGSGTGTKPNQPKQEGANVQGGKEMEQTQKKKKTHWSSKGTGHPRIVSQGKTKGRSE